ncbi:hypothetical protein SUGI_0990970 [Cryptomeria japonica]|uniref:uncharacterized protein LOC131033349 isoform X2 n=1 Tax=Cryptomeria japonica TaxID=3369 RepID=UPI002414BF19|nr:uncharacterized protein LOC131033349 isoform X2 [Cryptomeria japonica]XP_057820545.2 uncharacterized protein LOC131033349 isoform X2 [Cryptomeria japonica]GLJ46957.1 hypothetical protein SUGI_0990970 [Cryptomeria japonica]
METPYSGTTMAEIPALVSQNIASSPRKESVFASGRQVLLDMTNDSPNSGLDRVNGIETPASKIKCHPHSESVQTPGPGEALLHHDAKSIVQRVESNCIKPGFSLRTPLSHIDGYQASPSRLLAPTPANTPESATTTHVANNSSLSRKLDQTIGLSKDLGVSSLRPEFKDESSGSLSNTPLADKGREASFSSPISVDEAREENKVEEQGNNYHETENIEDGNEYNEQEEGETIEDDECEELCQGLNKVSVHDNGGPLEGIPAFAGKHTRFVYNSDDEIEGEEVASAAPSPSVVHLRGMPSPKGKHLRFEEDYDAEKASN